jgi:hypothetical protein
MGLECEGENGRYFHVSYRGYMHIWNLATENGFTQEKILTRQELRKVFRMDPELYDEYGVLPMGPEDATIMADTLEHALKNPLTEHPEMLRDFIEFSRGGAFIVMCYDG